MIHFNDFVITVINADITDGKNENESKMFVQGYILLKDN